MRVSTTSRLAYKKLQETKFSRQEAEVFDTLSVMPYATNKVLAKKLGWDASTVAGRMNSLKKKQIVTVDHTGTCPVTGQVAKHWKVMDYLQTYKNDIDMTKPDKPPKISSNQGALL